MDPDCSVTAWLKITLVGIIIGLPYGWDALKKGEKVMSCKRGLFKNKDSLYISHAQYQCLPQSG